MCFMNRREFLTASASGAASLALPGLTMAKSSKPKCKVERVAEDRFELITDSPSSVRILQITDTHFGRPNDMDRMKDSLTRKLIRTLVEEQKPDLIFHSGDFINNDTEGVEHSAIDFMNDLGTPWSLVFGNHDHSSGQRNGLSLDDYYKRLMNHATGFHTVKKDGVQSAREYCYRIDIKSSKGKPTASLLAFNCGGGSTPMIVSQGQMNWLREQFEADAKLGQSHPMIVMQHIPTIEYKQLFDDKAAVGRQGEKVCFEIDHGDVFEMYRASSRVKGVFCGHDHVNDYIGNHKGVRLAYGRVTGWAGYGDWQRGGRIIALESSPRAFKTRVVLPKGAKDKAEWQLTLADS